MSETSIKIDHIIDELLEEKKFATIKDILSTINASEVIVLFEHIDKKEVPVIFRLLPKDTAAEAFMEMDIFDYQVFLDMRRRMMAQYIREYYESLV